GNFFPFSELWNGKPAQLMHAKFLHFGTEVSSMFPWCVIAISAYGHRGQRIAAFSKQTDEARVTGKVQGAYCNKLIPFFEHSGQFLHPLHISIIEQIRSVTKLLFIFLVQLVEPIKVLVEVHLEKIGLCLYHVLF